MKRKNRIIAALGVAFTASLMAYAAAKVIDEKVIVKTLESNTKDVPIESQIGIQSIDTSEDGAVAITMTKDIKGKDNPTVLSSKKFTIQSGMDLTDINQRLEYAGLPVYTVEFTLTSKKPKVYSLTNVADIETVGEYNNRLYSEEMDCQRLANANAGLGNITDRQVAQQKSDNEKAGLGNITDLQANNQKTANKNKGLGEITDQQVITQRANNEKVGQGKYTDAELVTQREINEKAGYGKITDADSEKQRLANENAGLGKITDQQGLTQKTANKNKGLGEITDYQVITQRETNEKAGLGKITDQQVKTQKTSNKSNGLGDLTDYQANKQRETNEKAGLGKITDEQVKTQKSANKAAGQGDFTDLQLAIQREKNKKAGVGEITDAQLVKMQESLKEGKAFEDKKQWIHALAYYYDKIEENPNSDSAYILAAYNKIAEAIKAGKPGPGEYDVFSLYEGWKSLCTEYEQYWEQQEMVYGAVPSELKKGNLDYATKTGSYSLTFSWKYTKNTYKYKRLNELVKTGYKKAYKSDWSGMESNWPKDKDYTDTEKSYKAMYSITDKDGKNLMGNQAYAVSEGNEETITISGVSQSAMAVIDSGNYQVKVMEYGAMDYSEFETVKIPGKNLRMLTTEVYQELYQYVMGENPSEFKGDNLPVEYVSWYDAIMFCNKLSVKEGLTPVYAVDGKTNTAQWNYIPHKGNSIGGNITQNTRATGYRLPTVEEWQYAAKGGKDYTYAGSDRMDEVGWYNGNSGSKTHPVGGKKANGYGLYDMSGNVQEWCWDSYDNGRRYYCNGSYNRFDSYCEVSDMYWDYAHYRYDRIGFRIVRSASK